MEANHVNKFRPDDVLWMKISKGLLRNPGRSLKNTDKRMVYIYNNMFFVKKRFYFWLSNDKQTTFGRTAQAFLQEVSKLFITPIIRPSVAPVLIARSSTTLASPQPVFSPELLPPVQIPVTPELTTPQPPVQIPDPNVQLVFPDPPQTPVQLFLPDPPQPPVQILLPDPTVRLPPVVEILEPTLTDDSSIDQIMSSVFGDCSQQGIQAPPAHSQEPQVLDTVPSLFD
ncbi:hypothetical protein TNCV_3259991 [Trichonephila clavipes]|nr:hypothetical protein TNCV_3259991 [Trichonephila clavipes]